MNKSKRIRFNTLGLLLCCGLVGVSAQKHTETYNETFGVNENTVLELNTSHADIEFETWDKDQIGIEAVVTLEGATEEEAQRYFKRDPIAIMGNSKRIEISTNSGNSWSFEPSFSFAFDIPELDAFIVDIPEIPELPELAELPEFPALPVVPFHDFDYEAYKEDGEKYLKKWQKEFGKYFDEEYRDRMEEWAERMEARSAEREKRHQERMEERERARAERSKAREAAREERLERMEEAREKRKAAMKAQKAGGFIYHDSVYTFISGEGPERLPNTFYFQSDGEHKNYKVKKTIKIKMPKNTKIKMNVRHGEVKLAENTKNINATLSHAHLWASTIDGDQTDIRVSYSPVIVQKWKYGQLQTDYSENVDLREVLNLRLSATSSDVSIDHLLRSAFIKSDLGPLHINTVSENFKELDVTLQNAELICNLPSTAYAIYINGTNSRVDCPDQLKLDRKKNRDTEIVKGYHLDENNRASIVIHSKYSNVLLD
ncbi:hypothetical protein [Ulvibacterium sp.]|uniref:hypothetical protein n=1 Tax=Ulvibacterium sp. TaxID=2665914 RepID=UPI00262CDDB8|nr:hypothetical protein [Ulvibacterium sp.]